jgi:RimJ/RimL family protein N-acetyltransferase
MTNHVNHLGQQIGFPVVNWTVRPRPPRSSMEGRYCRVEPIELSHAADLHSANLQDTSGVNWTYLAYGPFERIDDYRDWMTKTCMGDDPLFHAVVDSATGRAVGVASYLRIEEKVGVIEVGHINYAPPLQRTRAGTEAMYLMMRRVFDELGYRRYEWKCDALNTPSRTAAQRLGFRFEGIFRQATIYKKRNRDTAWFSVIDSEWPLLKSAFERWLSPENFDNSGKQRQSLASLALLLADS